MVDCEINISGASSQRARSIELMDCSSKGLKHINSIKSILLHIRQNNIEKKRTGRGMYIHLQILLTFLFILP